MGDFVPNTPVEKVSKNRVKEEMKEVIDSNNWNYDFSNKTKMNMHAVNASIKLKRRGRRPLGSKNKKRI
jgi:hypothetical protein